MERSWAELGRFGAIGRVMKSEANNRKGQLGLTFKLQLRRLDCLSHLLLLTPPGRPHPTPPHRTLPDIVLCLDLWDLLEEMCGTRISGFVSDCDMKMTKPRGALEERGRLSITQE